MMKKEEERREKEAKKKKAEGRECVCSTSPAFFCFCGVYLLQWAPLRSRWENRSFFCGLDIPYSYKVKFRLSVPYIQDEVRTTTITQRTHWEITHRQGRHFGQRDSTNSMADNISTANSPASTPSTTSTATIATPGTAGTTAVATPANTNNAINPASVAVPKKPTATLGRPPGSTNEPRNKRKKYVFAKERKRTSGIILVQDDSTVISRERFAGGKGQ